jgi:hypothetical protein
LHMSKAALERVKSIGGWARYGEKMYELFSELTAQNCPAILSAAS